MNESNRKNSIHAGGRYILATVIICAFVKRFCKPFFAEKRFAKPFYGGF